MRGKFFPVDSTVLSLLLDRYRGEGWVEPILAYLVLAKHQQRGQPYTTAGAPAIAKALGLSRYRAERILDELTQVNWGRDPDQQLLGEPIAVREALGLSIPPMIGNYRVKVLPRMGAKILYLPNRLVEEKNSRESPLQQLNSLQPRSLRYDALSVLLKCYAYYDLQGKGGMDPTESVFAPWVNSGEVLEGYLKLGFQGSRKEIRRDWFFLLVSKPDKICAHKSFIDLTVKGDLDRFWSAFHSLTENGFLYEVAVVFDGNPLTTPSAEPLYPLRVFDQRYRDLSYEKGTGVGGLYAEAYNCLDRSGLMDENCGDFRYQTFANYSQGGEGTGFYAIAADVKTAMVMSVFRLRFLAMEHDSGLGFKAEEVRASYWKELLDASFR